MKTKNEGNTKKLKDQYFLEKTNLFQEAEKRKLKLTELIKLKEQELSNSKEGTIRIARNKKTERVQYFFRNDPKDKVGIYIKKSEQKLITELLQKKYDRKILSSAKKELEALNRLLKSVCQDKIMNTYASFDNASKSLITPVIYDDLSYISMWKKRIFTKKKFRENDNSEFYTKNGERVRSKSELLIANTLFDSGIPYIYEFPIELNNGLIVHPDFTVLNVGKRKTYYWEHLGMMDDREYSRDAIERLMEYKDSGIVIGDNLLVSMETSRKPLSSRDINQIINKMLIL